MMDWGNTGWGAGEWIAMSILMVAFWGALIALAAWGVQRLRSDRAEAPTDRADTLLGERYARGEIDDVEFARSRELLHTGGSSPSHSGL